MVGLPMQKGCDFIAAAQLQRRDVERQLESDLATGRRRAVSFAAAASLVMAALLVFESWGPPEAFEPLFQGMCALCSGVGLAYLHRRARRVAAAEDERERLGEAMRAALSPRPKR